MFEALWRELECKGSAQPVYEKLVSCYNSPERHYHTLEHVYWGLRRARELAEAERYPDENMLSVYWAMWFHDICMSFDPTNAAKDEELSASMAVVAAQRAGLSVIFQADVYRLVMATAHLKAPVRRDEAILIDADLSMLGADEEDFKQYEANIRKEWAHVADADFYRGRELVLQRFACMPRIFTTDSAHRSWEKQARKNIFGSRRMLAMASNRLEPALEFKETLKGWFIDGKDHTHTLILQVSDYDRYQRDATDADLVAVLKELRSKHPDRYAKMMAELNAT